MSSSSTPPLPLPTYHVPTYPPYLNLNPHIIKLASIILSNDIICATFELKAFLATGHADLEFQSVFWFLEMETKLITL